MVDRAVVLAHLEVLSLNKRLAKLSEKGGKYKNLHEESLPALKKIAEKLIPMRQLRRR